MTEPTPLDYAALGFRRRRRQIFSFAAFFIVAVPIALIYLAINLFLPHLEMIYKDFGARLPPATSLALAVCRFGVFGIHPINYLPATLVPLAGGFIVPLLGQPGESVSQRRWRWLVLLLLLLAMCLLLFTAMMLLLIMPLLSIIHGISPGR